MSPADATGSFALDVRGAYDVDASLWQAAAAGFVELPEATDRPVTAVELAFPVEAGWHPVAVRVAQEHGTLRAQVVANPERVALEDVREAVHRVLALDVDGAPFAALAADDPVVADLRRRFPGLRPVNRPSPYECAARAIVQHQLARPQAARVVGSICRDHGAALPVGDRVLHAFPAPAVLAELPPIAGLSARKVDQLRHLGGRTADGRLPTAHELRAMEPDEAMAALQESPGIGPFSAELVMVRGAGHPDVFPRTEPSLHRAMVEAYGLGEDVDVAAIERVADAWRPFRSWVGLLMRHTRE